MQLNLNSLKFSSDVNLTERSYFAVISALWNRNDVCLYIKNHLLAKREILWAEIENVLILYIESLNLPNTFILNLKSIIQPMGAQIVDWISMTKTVFQIFTDFTVKIKFIWSENGILDCIKTAKYIIDHNPSNKFLCCSLACTFCIEEIILNPDVHVLLPSILQQFKENASITETYYVYVWCLKLNLNDNELDLNIGEEEFRDYNNLGYILAEEKLCIPVIKYFLEILPPAKKRMRVLQTLHSILNKTKPHNGKLLLFLFSNLQETDINKLIHKNAYGVLSCCLEWPCQKFFMVIANSTWHKISEFQYLNLFIQMAEYVSQFHASNIYKNLLEQFWHASPSSFKNYIIHKCTFGSALSRLFLLKNTDYCIQLILNECLPNVRKQIIFYFENINICDFLVKLQRWESLKMFFLNCITTKDILEEFIVQYNNYNPIYRTEEAKQNMLTFIEKMKLSY